MRNVYLTYFIAILFACNTKCRTSRENYPEGPKSKFENIVKVQQFGDSMRLEIEQKGDTLIKHYIDLKDLDYDDFDDSYNVICSYKTIECKPDSSLNFPFRVRDYELYFNREAIISYCDSMSRSLDSNSDNYAENKSWYKKLENFVLGKSNDYPINGEKKLILNLKPRLLNARTKEEYKAILVESYKTEFSGGKNFSVIKFDGDTVNWFHQMDYIK